MRRLLPLLLLGIATASMAYAQTSPAQSVVSSPPSAKSNATPAPDTSPNDDAADSADVPSNDVSVDPASLIPDPPPLPKENATLIGGTIQHLDRVRDVLTLHAFGGGSMKIEFDPRTEIYLNGNPGGTADLHQGDRIYADTILNGDRIFARAIHLRNTSTGGESQGTIVAYHPNRNELLLRDRLSPRTIRVRLDSSTRIVNRGRTVSASDLVPGTLVNINFGSQQDGGDLAHDISILATPGAGFTFVGQVIGVDLHAGVMSLLSSIDNKNYDLYIDPDNVNVGYDLRPGAQVTVLTRFDGKHYVVRSVTFNSAANAQPKP